MVLDAGTAAQQATLLPSLPSRPGTEGAIVILPPEPGEQLTALRARGFPFVVVDPRTPVPRDIAAVSAAHFAGARSVTAHLAGLGHRRIGVIAGPHNWLAGAGPAGRARRGARRGGRPAPARADPSRRADRRNSATGPRANCSTCPSVPPRWPASTTRPRSARWPPQPSAACGCPADLSVTGFDDIDLAQATSPMLTTVRQPLAEMGRIAVSLLIRLLDGHQVEALHVELATDLIVRASTGPAPV